MYSNLQAAVTYHRGVYKYGYQQATHNALHMSLLTGRILSAILECSHRNLLQTYFKLYWCLLTF